MNMNMNMRKFWYFTAFCLIIIGVAGALTFWKNVDEDLPSFDKTWTFSAADLRKLHIVSDYDVDVKFVKSTDGENSIRLHGKGTEKMIENTIATEISSQSLKLNLVQTPKTWIQFLEFDITRAKEELIISVSDDSLLESLKIELDSGNINIADASLVKIADAELSADSGNLILNNFRSDRLELDVESGTITGNYITADTEASADSGNIKLENMTGRTNLSVDSGNIKLYKLDTADAEISADSGNVYVQVPAVFAGFYDLQVDSGKINSPDSKRETNDYVKVRADSGNITIEESRQ
ncbi:DUF4097 family beta strand repeat-containing protein [Cohnella lupini]|uniref:DUF4097 and DUF4098 domain-containing protein YvlB n=1 Tax=Cohnella lupini TaxID=1294267 RepID=A0A3D9I8C1_9BACL|nr:DUF4097 family beta strand repeat-containing protein [Cohnella lupini]RED58003.1 DUF4097 and DUF4098 domain-containing protein YvlB [Cohnella lupini]